MSDSERRHSGDWEGDLRPWYDHVELGQLGGIMRDVPSDNGLCYMLHVVLRGVIKSVLLWTFCLN